MPVTVKVTPDLSQFESQVKEATDKLSNKNYKVPVNLDFSAASKQVDAFFTKMNAKLSTPIKISLDTSVADRQLDALGEKIAKINGTSTNVSAIGGVNQNNSRLQALSMSNGGAGLYAQTNPNALSNLGSGGSTVAGSTSRYTPAISPSIFGGMAGLATTGKAAQMGGGLSVVGSVAGILTGGIVSGAVSAGQQRNAAIRNADSKLQTGSAYTAQGKGCPQCGYVNPPNAEFCKRCGFDFRGGFFSRAAHNIGQTMPFKVFKASARTAYGIGSAVKATASAGMAVGSFMAHPIQSLFGGPDPITLDDIHSVTKAGFTTNLSALYDIRDYLKDAQQNAQSGGSSTNNDNRNLSTTKNYYSKKRKRKRKPKGPFDGGSGGGGGSTVADVLNAADGTVATPETVRATAKETSHLTSFKNLDIEPVTDDDLPVRSDQPNPYIEVQSADVTPEELMALNQPMDEGSAIDAKVEKAARKLKIHYPKKGKAGMFTGASRRNAAKLKSSLDAESAIEAKVEKAARKIVKSETSKWISNPATFYKNPSFSTSSGSLSDVRGEIISKAQFQLSDKIDVAENLMSDVMEIPNPVDTSDPHEEALKDILNPAAKGTMRVNRNYAKFISGNRGRRGFLGLPRSRALGNFGSALSGGGGEGISSFDNLAHYAGGFLGRMTGSSASFIGPPTAETAAGQAAFEALSAPVTGAQMVAAGGAAIGAAGVIGYSNIQQNNAYSMQMAQAANYKDVYRANRAENTMFGAKVPIIGDIGLTLRESRTHENAREEANFQIHDNQINNQLALGEGFAANLSAGAAEMATLPSFSSRRAGIGLSRDAEVVKNNAAYGGIIQSKQDQIDAINKAYTKNGKQLQMPKEQYNLRTQLQTDIKVQEGLRDAANNNAGTLATFQTAQSNRAEKGYDIDQATATKVAQLSNTDRYGAQLAGIEGARQKELNAQPDKRDAINKKYDALSGQVKEAMNMNTGNISGMTNAQANLVLGAQQNVNGFGFQGAKTSIQGNIDVLNEQKRQALLGVQGSDPASIAARKAIEGSFNPQIDMQTAALRGIVNQQQAWNIGINASIESQRQTTLGDSYGAAKTGIEANYQTSLIQFRNDKPAKALLDQQYKGQMQGAKRNEQMNVFGIAEGNRSIKDSIESQTLRNAYKPITADVTDVQNATSAAIREANNDPNLIGHKDLLEQRKALLKKSSDAQIQGILNPFTKGTNYGQQTSGFMFGGDLDENPYKDLIAATDKAKNAGAAENKEDKDSNVSAGLNSNAPTGDQVQQLITQFQNFISIFNASNGN